MKFELFLVLISSVLIVCGKKECGGATNKSPYRVDIVLKGLDSNKALVVRNCSGTTVSKTVILTSAQCLKDMTTATVSQPLLVLKETVDKTRFFIHPDYNNSIYNDIAVIKLKNVISNAIPVDIPSACEAKVSILDRKICSCGDVQKVISRCDCQPTFNPTFVINNSMICVNRSETISLQDCQENLGKGLILNVNGACAVVGVLSLIKDNQPRIYTKVLDFAAFVQMHTLV